ncbi:helix-turn-helix domain-containing protein [Halomonas sp. S3-1-8]
MSRAEAARELDCHPATVSRWVKDGTLPGLKIGGKTYVSKPAFEQMIAQGLPVEQNTGAPGAITGEVKCLTSAPIRRTGGSISHPRAAEKQLDALLGRKTGRKPKR